VGVGQLEDFERQTDERFQQLLDRLGLLQAPNRTARTESDALRLAEQIGYPLVVRPSYVLGGRAMEIVHEQKDLERYMREAVKVSNDSPVLLDRFLSDATEVDVDAVSDGERVAIGGGQMLAEHGDQPILLIRQCLADCLLQKAITRYDDALLVQIMEECT